MILALGPRAFDLDLRAVLIAGSELVDVHPRPTTPPELGQRIHDLLAQGADLVELRLHHLSGSELAQEAIAGPGQVVLRSDPVAGDTAGAVTRTGQEGWMVLAPAGGPGTGGPQDGSPGDAPPRAVLEPAARAGIPPGRVDRWVLDTGDDPVAAAVGICRGYRLVRTTDLVGAGRVRDVLAAVMDRP